MTVWKHLAKRLGILAGLSGVGAAFLLEAVPKINETRRTKALLSKPKPSATEVERFQKPLPTRAEHIERMSSGQIFDVLVIGGGATGAGIAVDAASRGLTTCLVERLDFASGTSSRSTKLIHGGVRYLQKAIFKLDFEQFRMVNEALGERANLIDIAPHLAYPLPIMLPVYKWWQLPYFWAGIKMYDLISGGQILKASYYLSKPQVLERFPLLKQDKLVGGLVYYDGQHEDARMCLSIALTAVRYNACIANYVEAVEILKGKPYPTTRTSANKLTGKELSSEKPQTVVNGARVRDLLNGKEFVIRARCVINATGPYTDTVRLMDDSKQAPICQPSSGVHIILPGYYSPSQMGLLDPSTRDGRVIFFLPWMNFSLAGTTDTPCSLTDSPSPTEGEVSFILDEIRDYLSPDIKVRRGDVLAAWSGIRPLVRDPNSSDTQSIARNHVIEVSSNRLITIAGGKWTTYRSMAEETVDKAIEVCGLQPTNSCRTKGLLLEGAHLWSPNLFIKLVQEHGMDVDVARHLTGVYGDKAISIANIASLTGMRWPILGKKLHPEFPFIEAEVKWACQEYACRAVDFVARRTRLAFLNAIAAQEALPRIVELMGAELGWDKKKQKEELEHAQKFLGAEMGFNLSSQETVPLSLTLEETDLLLTRFRRADSGGKGYISLSDLERLCDESGQHLNKESLQNLLRSMDLNRNGQVDVAEFLHFMSALKTGNIAHSPFKRVFSGTAIPVHRSGGGV
ncbi:Mitochondrial glycerol-3-phosphate dehydrogenase [Fasciola hepatica]|uniref:Glycerol-3-phosphate dehydrogenase n=1 Tax=Fasciola hepatica TaxID=6192 RepID=A0A4E0R634_FASHE|nr:Mitochondrial glycerol-3-phosphate dehydrogenase [Fasciola hepatica]